MKRWVPIVLLFVLSAFPTGSRASELVNRIVAIVGDDVITMAELSRLTKPEEERILKRFRGPEQKRRILEIRKKYLESLITDRLIQKEVKREGIHVSDEQIDRNIELWRTENGLTKEEMEAELKRRGLDMKTYRKMLKSRLQVQLLLRRLEKQIVVSDKEIEDYFAAHKNEFIPRNRVHLKTILIRASAGGSEISAENRKKAEKVLTRLQEGESFERLARRFSEGPNAAAGGDASWIDWNLLDPLLKKTIERMKPGDISPLLLIDRGGTKWYQIIKLVEREVPGPPTLEKARPRIVQILMKKKRRARKEEWLKKLRQTYFVKVTL